MGRLSLCAGKVWVEGVQSLYLPGQAEMWAGRWRELQPGEVGERKGSHLSAGEGKGNYGGIGAFSDAGREQPQMRKLLSCEFNIDMACVELKFADGTMI